MNRPPLAGFQPTADSSGVSYRTKQRNWKAQRRDFLPFGRIVFDRKACEKLKDMAVKLQFDDRKSSEAAALMLGHPSDRMKDWKLFALLYLADREALLRLGCPITMDRYFLVSKRSRHHDGVSVRMPILANVDYLIGQGASKTIISAHRFPSQWSTLISFDEITREAFLSQLGEIVPQRLSDAEIELLNEIRRDYGQLDDAALIEKIQTLPELGDLYGDYIEISYRDILLHAGRSSEEIEFIEQELASLETGSFFEPRLST